MNNFRGSKKSIGLLILLAVLFSACDEKPEELANQGIISLSTELVISGTTYLGYGLILEGGQVFLCPDLLCRTADLVAIHLTDIHGVISGAYLESPGNDKAFHLNGEFSGASEAKSFFDGYHEVSSTDFQVLTDSLRENQVWTIQTKSKNYAKILILEMNQFIGQESDYFQIKMEFSYQPDGTKKF